MNKTLLSVCIPTYNRAELLRSALMSLVPQIKELGDTVELIVSDNCSTDHTKEVVEWARQYGPIRYSINSENIGFMHNILKLANELARGEFCWIVGDDDFVMPEALKKIHEIFETHNDIDYIFAVEDHIETKMVLDIAKNNIHASSKDFKYLSHRKNNIRDAVFYDRWENLIDPEVAPDYLGFLPNSIFRISLWRSVDMSDISGAGFDDWRNVYPHIYIWGKSLFGKKAYYSGESLIIMGNGSRDWQGDNGFWSGNLPVIYLRYFDDIINFYHRQGLIGKHYKKCRKAQASKIGGLLFDYLYKRYKHKITITAIDQINNVTLLKYIVYYELWSRFIPDLYLAITAFLKKKLYMLIGITNC